MLLLRNATCLSGAELILLRCWFQWLVFEFLLEAQHNEYFFWEGKKRVEGRVTFPPWEGKPAPVVSCSVLSWEWGGSFWCHMVLLVVNSLERTKTPTSNFGSRPSSSLFRLGKFWTVGDPWIGFLLYPVKYFLMFSFCLRGGVCMFLLTVWRQTGGTVIYCAWWGQGRGRSGGR